MLVALLVSDLPLYFWAKIIFHVGVDKSFLCTTCFANSITGYETFFQAKVFHPSLPKFFNFLPEFDIVNANKFFKLVLVLSFFWMGQFFYFSCQILQRVWHQKIDWL